MYTSEDNELPSVVCSELAFDETSGLVTPMRNESPLAVNDRARKNVFIIDYDDTILCSSHLARLGLHINSDLSAVTGTFANDMADLTESSIKLINSMAAVGSVYIVTNSDDGWVDSMTRKFLPGLEPVINEKVVKIVSAKRYAPLFPNCFSLWKKIVIFDLVIGENSWSAADGTSKLHLYSFGDSPDEKEAAEDISNCVSNIICKTVQFIAVPTVNHLITQQKYLLSLLDEIVKDENHVNQRFYIK